MRSIRFAFWILILIESFPDRTSAQDGPSINHPIYTGSLVCRECHLKEYTEWKESDHAKAMDLPTPATVKGDFNSASFTYSGKKTSFYKKGEKYFVKTEGADGQLTEFPIAYTFGFYPLQQYLIQFPRGRLQALSVAWDDRPESAGGKRWFHLYPNEQVTHRDILHWTKVSQNWNFMCAECHSTNLRKNYDQTSETFKTTWSEMNVGCEACHGQASRHVDWARLPKETRPSSAAAIVPLRHPPFSAKYDSAAGRTLPSAHPGRSSEISTCARCHSLRTTLHEEFSPGGLLLDTHRPALIEEQYLPDGQILDEAYEYGSFAQSKMYQSGVTCSDCHNPHSGKIKFEGNTLCAQCHLDSKYNSPAHHFHKSGSAGSECKSCHMPSKTYMGVDVRYDHSFRVPHPELAQAIKSRDACLNCHTDKPSKWSIEAVSRWYGAARVPEPKYGRVFAAARSGESSAAQDLMNLANDPAESEIVRATALSNLQHFPSPSLLSTLETHLRSGSELLRLGALSALENMPPSIKLTLAASSLTDPVRAVRIEAARQLAAVPRDQVPAELSATVQKASEEYIAAEQVNAESPQAQANLGVFYALQGRYAEAEQAYRFAIKLEPYFIPAYINLADLMRGHGRDVEGEVILKAALELDPDNADGNLALALLCLRKGDKQQALQILRKVEASGISNPHFSYIYVVVLRDFGQAGEAQRILDKALERNPNDSELRSLVEQ